MADLWFRNRTLNSLVVDPTYWILHTSDQINYVLKFTVFIVIFVGQFVIVIVTITKCPTKKQPLMHREQTAETVKETQRGSVHHRAKM